MRALTAEQRTKNVGRNAVEQCRWCDDTGYVCVQTRPAESAMLGKKRIDPAPDAVYEELGPCPYCQAGYREEFPEPGNREHPILPPWGDEGFWKGRDFADLIPARPAVRGVLSREENAAALAELRARLGTVGREIEV